MPEDILIAGGRVLDPASGRDEIADVLLLGGKVAAIAPNLPREGRRVVEAAGLLVTPGLVDVHTHCYWGGTLLGVNPDKIGARTGVTTWVDCGSSGAATFEGFLYHVIRPSRVRILPLINLSYIGLTAAGNLSLNVGELDDWRFADLGELRRVGREFGEHIVGVKLRASNNASGPNAPIVLPLAREAADMLGVPLMVHVGVAPPTIDEVLPFLREGDILTHIYNPAVGGGVLDRDGMLRPGVRAALDRGVLMEVGHGGSSFSFAIAEAAMGQGLRPSAIGTDLHAHNIDGPVFELPTTLAKFMCLGMSLEEVLGFATWRAADMVRRPDLGRLAVGGPADVAVFRLDDAAVSLVDSVGERRDSRCNLRNVVTICRGDILEPFDDGRKEGRTYR